MTLTVLVENCTAQLGLLAEHGLAFWLEIGKRQILFDTGQGQVLGHNARHLGIHLADADTLILSHGHYDHTGGIATALAGERRTWVYAHPAAFAPKFARTADGTGRPVGIAADQQEAIRSRGELLQVTGPVDLGGGLHVTGPVPRTTDFEDTGGPFFADAGGTAPDPLLDDQAAWFDSPAGTVVILGCAHAGVINTLLYVREQTAGRPLHAVVGGMHLVNATEDRLARTIEALRELAPQRLYPCHCTGFLGIARLWQAFPDRVRPCPVGTTLDFSDEP